MSFGRRKPSGRECEPPMPEALAYFLTWTTYGTWLPGDERGWVQYRYGMQLLPRHERTAYQPDARARDLGHSPRWRVGLVWGRMRNSLAGVMSDPIAEREAAARMTEDACLLDREQRRLVETTITDHCRVRGSTLYAVNCRSNHVHVLVAANRHPKEVRDQFKTWCTRRLKGLEQERRCPGSAHPSPPPEGLIREKWWTERGSGLYINDEEGLEAVIHYVLDAQDLPREMRQ